MPLNVTTIHGESCIHCGDRPREFGLYCAVCMKEARQHADLALATCRPSVNPTGRVQRQKFDDGTCPCHRFPKKPHDT